MTERHQNTYPEAVPMSLVLPHIQAGSDVFRANNLLSTGYA